MSLGIEARQHEGGDIVGVTVALVMLMTSNVISGGQIQALEKMAVPVMVNTSWYGRELQGHRMANGERFRAEDPTTVAHKQLPLGTKLELTDPENGHSLIVTVKDRGPYADGRDLDVSMAAADKLGLRKKGTKVLLVKVLN